jgi:N-acetylmuramoyl-L-alanine amidase
MRPTKKTAAVFLACALCFGLASLYSAPSQAQKLRVVRTVVIDPGHGGSNEGAHSATGALEKDLALRIAYQVRARLQRDHPGLKVVLTRNIDIDLSLPERLSLAHDAGADLFFSLHLNAAANKQATGLEVYYLRHDKATPMLPDQGGTWGEHYQMPADVDDPQRPRASGEALPLLLEDLERGRLHKDSALLAELLYDELGRACAGRQMRGVRQQNFGVLRGARVPAVVVELGFISNQGEAAWVEQPENQQRYARAISRAVQRVDDVFVRKNYQPDGRDIP